MILIKSPKLIMHYAPGVLVVLRRTGCPGQKTGFGGGHFSCACDGEHQIFKVAGTPTLLDGDEQGWVLNRSWIRR